MICNICPRKCNKERNEKEGFGYCGVGTNPIVARAALHFFEEPCLSSTSGSGTIFFSSCNLRCEFCQNHEISFDKKGELITKEKLVQLMKKLEQEGANNINFVTPTHYSFLIRDALDLYKPSIPIIYNTSGYELVEEIKKLDGYVDIFLPDLKYYSREYSLMLSNADNYFTYASKAIEQMIKQVGVPVFENGIMKKGVIIRHLVLPRLSEDSIEILKYIKENYPPYVYVSIMSQYTPLKKYDHDFLNRRITKREYDKVVDYALSLKLDNIYIQELESASSVYVPDFYDKL